MVEINPCIASGCLGLCCQDTYLDISEFERTRLFKKAVQVDSFRELSEFKKNHTPGIFYIEGNTRTGLDFPDMCTLLINGTCPNKLSNGSCSQHEEREHAARNFNIGSDDCNEIRKEHGLRPIKPQS